MTFVKTQRNYQKYLDKISKKAEKTQKGFKTSHNSFDRFCDHRFKSSGEETIEELKLAEDEAVFDTLQEWINWMDISPNTIPIYFTHMKTYLYWRGIKINSQDVKLELDFPKQEVEELHPLSLDEVRMLLGVANYKNRCMYLCMLSGGFRPVEITHIKKKDLELDKKRIVIHVPARYTKLKRTKTSFISSEAQKMLRPILKRINDNDFVFGGNSNSRASVFARYCDKVGLDSRYDTTQIRKITLMGFRAYFITKLSRHDPNLAKKWAGQKGYLLQYDRMTPDEQLEKYLEFEPDLLINDTVRKDRKIEDLEKKNVEIEALRKNQKDDKKTLKILSQLYMLEATEPVIHTKEAYDEEDQFREELRNKLKKLIDTDELVLDF